MTARAAFVIAVGAIACRPQTPPPVSPVVGSESDDGHGELARASSALRLGDETSPAFSESQGSWYGALGAADYGGGAYGGADYATLVPVQPQLRFHHHLRGSRRTAAAGLTGFIEGAIAWGTPPPHAPCSAPRVALVFIETYSAGRTPPAFARANPGIVAKHGCALVPAAQVVASSPAAVVIHGDAARATVQVTAPDATHASFDVQEAGLVQVELQPGVTRVDGDGLAPAWLVAIDTPYYAVTDDAGRFRLDELEPATYVVTIWAPPATAAGAPIVLHRTVRVDGKSPAQLHVALGR